MSVADWHRRLSQNGDSLRVLVQRLSDLSLFELNEVSRLVKDARAADDEPVCGLQVGPVRAAVRDAPGSCLLADIRARERQADAGTPPPERDAVVDGIVQSLPTNTADEVRALANHGLEQYPSDGLVALTAGLAHWALGDPAAAAQCFARAQTSETSAGLMADAVLLQSLATAEAGDLERALTLLEWVAGSDAALEPSWTRPVGRARYEQARLLAARQQSGTAGADLTESCHQVLIQAIEANGFFFGPAYIDPCFAFIPRLAADLQDRFNAISIRANLVRNAGDGLVRDLRRTFLVDHEALEQKRLSFQADGFFSRSRLIEAGLRTAVRLRDDAAAGAEHRLAEILRTRDADYAKAETTRQRGEARAESELQHGAQATRALDMRAFTIKETMSGRFHLDAPLEPQYDKLADESRSIRNERLAEIIVGAVVLIACALIFVPPLVAKIAAGAVLAGIAGGLAFWRQRRYRQAIAELDAELERARGVKSIEHAIVETTEHSKAKSEVARDQAERDRQARLQHAIAFCEQQLAELRRSVDALVEANTRFFRHIEGEDLPEARFKPPKIEAGEPPAGVADPAEADATTRLRLP